MSKVLITHCPGTLKPGVSSYSTACLKRLFDGHKVHHVLPYNSPASDPSTRELFTGNQKRISISGVQEKFSVVLDKNKLRLSEPGEQGQYILKPIPNFGKRVDQMPANEHTTMQIARQVFQIETAENALIFFKNGAPAYITKRFDVIDDGKKRAKEDFASLLEKTPYTHGDHYKYTGNYLDLFHIMKRFLPAYQVEAPKLFKLLVFNYLFGNGDAHLKNFSVLETPMGDFMLSPAYDLVNSRIHIEDADFALEQGLLPGSLAGGSIKSQFNKLAKEAGIRTAQVEKVFEAFEGHSEKVEALISVSFMDEKCKRHYIQIYQKRLKMLSK